MRTALVSLALILSTSAFAGPPPATESLCLELIATKGPAAQYGSQCMRGGGSLLDGMVVIIDAGMVPEAQSIIDRNRWSCRSLTDCTHPEVVAACQAHVWKVAPCGSNPMVSTGTTSSSAVQGKTNTTTTTISPTTTTDSKTRR